MSVAHLLLLHEKLGESDDYSYFVKQCMMYILVDHRGEDHDVVESVKTLLTARVGSSDPVVLNRVFNTLFAEVCDSINSAGTTRNTEYSKNSLDELIVQQPALTEKREQLLATISALMHNG
jgi:effector-binding domain-containing protein